MTSRGNLVVIDFPYSDGSGSKVRPSLIVQNDADNKRLRNTIVAMITGNISHAPNQRSFSSIPPCIRGRDSTVLRS